MRARLRIALNVPDTPEIRRHGFNVTDYEVTEVSGEGPDWETARNAALAAVPEGARGLAWFQDE